MRLDLPLQPLPPGDLVFDRLSLRYFPGGPLALRGVSFHFRDREKVRRRGR